MIIPEKDQRNRGETVQGGSTAVAKTRRGKDGKVEEMHILGIT